MQSTSSAKFYDADLFLTYIRSFFYEDFSFVAALLDPDATLNPGAQEGDSALAIALYFQERFGQLASTSVDVVEKFERAVSAGETFDWGDESVGGNPQEAALGRERLMRMREEIEFDGPPKSTEDHLKRNDHFLLAQRDLMCMASFPAPVKVNEHGRTLVGEYHSDSSGDFRIPLVSLPALKGAAPGQGNGSLEFFLSVRGRYILSTVTLGDKIVAVNSLSDNFSEDMKEQISSFWASQAAVTEQRELRLAAIRRALSEPTASVYAEHYRQNSARIADETYAIKGLLFTPGSQLARCRELLHENGLFKMLGNDPDFIRVVALVSLAISYTFDRASVAEFLAKRGVRLDEVLGRLKNCWDANGLPVVLEHSDELLWSYV